MKFDDYFFPLFQKTQNIDPNVILNKIRQNSTQEFFVLADQFNLSWLRDCINESNCRVIFHSGDSIAAASRSKFLTDTLDTAKKKNIIFISSDFTKPDVRSFLNNGATVQMWKHNSNAIKHEITSLCRTFPDQIRLVSTGFLKFWILKYLRDGLKMQLLFRVGSFLYADLKTFATKGKERVCIINDDFSPEELAELQGEGAIILRRPAAVSPIA